MVKKSNVKRVIDALEEIGRMTKTKAVTEIMKKTDLSRQTVLNAIDIGIGMNKILTEDDYRGRLKIIWISTTSQASEIEKITINQINDLFTGYDERFELFKNNLNNLTMEERADGIDAFAYFLIMAKILISAYSFLYGKTRKWTNLLAILDKRMATNQELIFNVKEKDVLKIVSTMVENRAFDVVNAYEDIDEFLKENKL